MNLAALVLSALLALHRGTLDEADEGRYREIAEAIAEGASSAPLFSGDAGEIATAAALVAIGHHESGFQEGVRRCRVRGDEGRSIGVFQLMRGRAWQGRNEREICASDALQVELALSLLHKARRQCPRCVPAFWFRAYASGNGGLDTPAARAITASFARISRRMGVEVYPTSEREPRLLPVAPDEPTAIARPRRKAA